MQFSQTHALDEQQHADSPHVSEQLAPPTLHTHARNERILQAVALAAEKFLRDSAWDIDLPNILGQLGEAADVSRVYIFENHTAPDGTLLTSQRYEWTAPGITPQLDNPDLQDVPWLEAGFGRWYETLQRGGLIYGHIREFPPSEQAILFAQDIQSILVVPIFVGDQWWGFIGFDECRYERNWTLSEIEALRTAANILGAALQRYQAEKKAAHHTRELQVMGDILDALNATPDVQRAFGDIAEGLRHLTQCDRVSLTLLERDNRYFRIIALDQKSTALDQGIPVPVSNTSAADDILAGRLHLTPDIREELDHPSERVLYEAGYRSRVNIPLRVEGRVLGTLNLAWYTYHGYKNANLNLLSHIAHAVALAIERTRFFRAEAQRREEAETLYQAATALTTHLNPEDVLELILEHLAKVVHYDSATVFLRREGHLAAVAWRGFPENHTKSMEQYPLTNPLFQQIMRTREPIVLHDASQDPRFENWGTTYTIRGWIGAPLIVRDKVIGFLTLDNAEAGAYGEQEVKLVQAFAIQAAIALENAHLYQKVLNTNRELEEALKVRTELVHNVSHELRTPLTLILGLAELLEMSPDLQNTSESTRRTVRSLVREAKHLRHLVNQVISLKRLEQQHMRRQSIDVREWLIHVATAWQSVMASNGHILRLDIAADVQTVEGDIEYLRQVVNNLLDNAHKYSPAGSTIWLRAWQDEEQVFIAVSDEGIGVPADALERIFDQFYRVERKENYTHKGLGMGLALCREIVERHGGRIWAENRPNGSGLTVTFTLPRPRA